MHGITILFPKVIPKWPNEAAERARETKDGKTTLTLFRTYFHEKKRDEGNGTNQAT